MLNVRVVRRHQLPFPAEAIGRGHAGEMVKTDAKIHEELFIESLFADGGSAGAAGL